MEDGFVFLFDVNVMRIEDFAKSTFGAVICTGVELVCGCGRSYWSTDGWVWVGGGCVGLSQ